MKSYVEDAYSVGASSWMMGLKMQVLLCELQVSGHPRLSEQHPKSWCLPSSLQRNFWYFYGSHSILGRIFLITSWKLVCFSIKWSEVRRGGKIYKKGKPWWWEVRTHLREEDAGFQMRSWPSFDWEPTWKWCERGKGRIYQECGSWTVWWWKRDPRLLDVLACVMMVE